MSVKCRVWWPKELSNSSNLVLFGWIIHRSTASIDVVVAFGFEEAFLSLHSNFSALQMAIGQAHKAMPVRLQDRSSLIVLGCCVLPSANAHKTCKLNLVDCNYSQPFEWHQESLADSIKGSCECLKYDGLLQQYSHACLQSSTWIQLVHDTKSNSADGVFCVPSLDHVHMNGKLLSPIELNVMVFQTPRYGSHHFSVNSCSSDCTKCTSRKPNWVSELCQKPQLIELEMVFLAINSSAAAKFVFERCLGVHRSCNQLSILYMFLNLIWKLFAAVTATFSTFLYIVLQSFHKLAGYVSNFKIGNALMDIFSNTLINIKVRCYQILYWPVFLDQRGPGCQACVEYAEKEGLRRHSLWSSALVDVILGNLAGYALLWHADAVCQLISTFAIHFTDDVLRTGCVWLMGVPAGFKLNMELAGVLSTLFLFAIQIWTTLWFLVAEIFHNGVKVVALSGILLGMTVLVALTTDVISIATFHVYTLHQFVAFFYSFQIQALTALWRLFRGRKWNPLRQRLDSYEYSVEQHVVGSLLFTPLLLLLPTTSVFYIFFATIHLAIIFLHMLGQIIVSVIHDTPYNKLLLWCVSSKRFPSGIWFDIMHSQYILHDQNMNSRKPALLLSFVRSNILTLGQLVLPHYKNIFSGVRRTLAPTLTGILTGRSIVVPQSSEVRHKLPWISISCKDYWCICYYAILACMQS